MTGTSPVSHATAPARKPRWMNEVMVFKVFLPDHFCISDVLESCARPSAIDVDPDTRPEPRVNTNEKYKE
jgi:hypothetical protein